MADQTSLSPRGALLLGLLFAACGAALIPSALGVGPVRPTPGTPGWVAVCAAVLFVLGGAALINGYAIGGGFVDRGDFRPGTPFGVRVVQYLLGLAIVGLMIAVSGWIAFGPGERHFATTIALPFFAQRSVSSGASGRVAFGVGTLMLAAMFVGLGWSGARRLRAQRRGL